MDSRNAGEAQGDFVTTLGGLLFLEGTAPR